MTAARSTTHHTTDRPETCTFCLAPIRGRGYFTLPIHPFTMVYWRDSMTNTITVTCEPSCHPNLSFKLVAGLVGTHPYRAEGVLVCTSCRIAIDRQQWSQLDRAAARALYRQMGRPYAEALAWASGEHAMIRLHRTGDAWLTADEIADRRLRVVVDASSHDPAPVIGELIGLDPPRWWTTFTLKTGQVLLVTDRTWGTPEPGSTGGGYLLQSWEVAEHVAREAMRAGVLPPDRFLSDVGGPEDLPPLRARPDLGLSLN